VFHACNPSYSRGRDQKNLGLRTAQANSSQGPISKILNTHTTKRAGRMAEVVKCLPSKGETLSSSPSTPPPQRKKVNIWLIVEGMLN
jgi:hypothetical protein